MGYVILKGYSIPVFGTESMSFRSTRLFLSIIWVWPSPWFSSKDYFGFLTYGGHALFSFGINLIFPLTFIVGVIIESDIEDWLVVPSYLSVGSQMFL